MRKLRIREVDFEAVRLSRQGLDRVDAVLGEAVASLLGGRIRNVVGVGRGHKWVGGLARAEACIQVQVAEKVDADRLDERDRIPESIGDVRTDVVEVGHVVFSELKNKVRPLESGYSVGAIHKGAKSTGTLGAFATCLVGSQKHFFILSCNHVLANNNVFPAGTEVIQPGPNDGGTILEAVGQLWAFVPLSTTQDNLVDTALATVEEDLIIPIRPYVAQCVPAAEITIGMAVMKNGKTTELTAGVVTADKVTIMVADAAGNHYTMTDQLTASYRSEGGDSGALVVSRQSNKAVGLHFAGTPGVAAYMNVMENVLGALKVSLY
ncbi:hypothetical protein GKC30_08510 [Pseudodesulfovibrio sp. F-1]|uniref:Serine protease n=1 Tax=Pseudodesulfovibrio alkaliphilus TaxID=2661613 RepID=A0A7K1KNL7_9BACT|nr:hypothetical protein [Pseudodesulfovibrio alkaliphilus]MUM77673.1 hypothetical protein [Pseudodesulfovibrio alkaliphilus]